MCYRVRLSKRRARGGGGIQSATNAVLAVKHREMHEQELAAQEMRRIQLEPLEPDDDEEEEEEADETANADEEVLFRNSFDMLTIAVYIDYLLFILTRSQLQNTHVNISSLLFIFINILNTSQAKL